MQKLLFLGLLLFSFTACHSQEQQSKNGSKTSITQQTPHGSWTVHKRFDANGNLISKDSTYTYSYSSINGQPVSPEKMDSIQQLMRQQMQAHFGNMPNFASGFFSNTPMRIDSLHQQFFSQNGFPNMAKIQQQMLQQMQAMQQQFGQVTPQHSPRFIPREAPAPKTNTPQPKSSDKQESTPPDNVSMHSL